MCGRYYIPEKLDFEIDKYFRTLQENYINNTSDENASLKLSGEIFPTNIVPVIANNKSLEPYPFAMKWGFTFKDNKKPIINARSETASEKFMFKDGIKQRRCLIPASHYFEWEKQGDQKIKHTIWPDGMKSMYLVGIYRIEQGMPVFSILTRQVSDSIAFIHSRMPVIFPIEAQNDWLNIKNNADEVIKSALLEMEYK